MPGATAAAQSRVTLAVSIINVQFFRRELRNDRKDLRNLWMEKRSSCMAIAARPPAAGAHVRGLHFPFPGLQTQFFFDENGLL